MFDDEGIVSAWPGALIEAETTFDPAARGPYAAHVAV
jgi:hypothetical protein